MIDTLVRYGPGGQHPILREPGSPWVVVGMTGPSWWHLEQSRPRKGFLARARAWLAKIGIVKPHVPFYTPDAPVSVDIHLDADDPLHVFLDQSAWSLFPNARKLADWYNARHRKSQRLRARRAFESTSEDRLRFDNERTAADALALQAMIIGDPENAHISGSLEYYPDGFRVKGPQVWRDGKFWLRITL